MRLEQHEKSGPPSQRVLLWPRARTSPILESAKDYLRLSVHEESEIVPPPTMRAYGEARPQTTHERQDRQYPASLRW